MQVDGPSKKIDKQKRIWPKNRDNRKTELTYVAPVWLGQGVDIDSDKLTTFIQ